MTTSNQPAQDPVTAHAGATLGMPAAGPGSMARLGPRIVAVIIDWLVCSVIAAGFFGYEFGGGGTSWAPLAVFFVENVLLVGTLGSTLGHRIMGMHVAKVSGAPAGPLGALIRSVLLCIFVPAVIWDKDGRGLHDRFAGTVLRRTR
ncbi:MAG TPA: RDD family protein [Flexivirga sp.]|uniref:RDD family protein n=1 Tax=Flexivirga sp. TaxID=1962927 RepID=UPI002C61E15D|nr:RDD family protein [Flexivirga sp.]HWC23807.1 RDD family protein [Flexivirga sp.]